MKNRRKKAFALLVIYSLIIFKLNSRRNIKVNYNEEYDKCGDSYFACLDDKNIFIVDDRDSVCCDDNIYVIDSRYDDDPNMIVYNSYKIKSLEEIKEILKILKEYERQYPSKWERSILSMEYEWIVHNLAYYLNIYPENSKDVDLNNTDEGVLIPKFGNKIKEKIKQQETKIIENKANIDKELITSLKNIQTEIKEINLKILIGTENASLTAFIIPAISTFIAMFLSKQIRQYNEKQVFCVAPAYMDKNLINVEFSGIFQIKMIHIINTICIVNKKRKGDKNERTSNRRAYDYGYEQY